MGSPQAALSLTPADNDFGNIQVSASSTAETFTLSNSGEGRATEVHISMSSGAHFTLSSNTCGTSGSTVTVEAGANCTFDVTFSPVSTGAKSDTITATFHDGQSAGQTTTASVTGNGDPAPTAFLSFGPASRDFGSITEGANSTAQTFTVTNGGSVDATDVFIALSTGTDFAISNNTCGTSGARITVAASDTCTFDITFSPTTTGALDDTLTVTYHNGDSAGQTATADLDGVGLSPAVLAFSPASHDFGDVTAGASSGAQSFTITNSGASDATDVFIALTTGTQFAVSSNNCGVTGSRVTVPAGDDCTFDITFSPNTTGALDDTITVTYHNGAAAGQTETADLDGNGLSVASLAFSPASRDFGDLTVGASSGAQTFTITNSGASDATDVFIALSTGTQFAVSSNNCGVTGSRVTVPAGDDCTFDVTFSPNATGALDDTITVTYHNGAAAGQTATAALDGNGLSVASLAFSPASRDFGDVTVGASSGAQTFTITNSGASDATDVFIALTTGTQFAISSNNCGVTGSRVTVPAGDDCTFDITFSPNATGALDDTLTVTYNNGISAGQTATADLDGNGLSVASLAFTPASRDFGDLTVGASSGAQTFTITNSGASDATDVFIALTTGTQFAISSNNCGVTGSRVTVPAGDDCTFDITFSPNTTGALDDTITVTYHNGAAAGQTATAALDGNGLSTADLSFSPLSHDFGDTGEGTSSAAQTFTISNSGGSDATSVFVALTTGTQFSISSNNCGVTGNRVTVPAGDDCTFDVTFEPTSQGAKDDTLTINYHNGAAAGQTATATLDGNGTAVTDPPANLSYSHPTVAYVLNTQIPDNTPTITGDVTSWSITVGTLPTGLSFDTGTGVISGTPTAQNASAPAHDSLTIRATNGVGWVETQIQIAVLGGYVVNSTGADDDANPGNGICATAGGQCTFRAAISEALAQGGEQAIYLPDGSYPLSDAIDYSYNNGLNSLQITGESRDGTIIDLSGGGMLNYTWQGGGTVPDLTVTAMTFTGATNSTSAVLIHGNSSNAASLVISNTRFVDNDRAAVWTLSGADTSLVVENSEFIRNHAHDGVGSGAISHAQSLPTERAVIRNSLFQENTTNGNGGAISGAIDVYSSSFIDNSATAAFAGAFFIMGEAGETTIIQDSRFIGNSAADDGGVFSNGWGDDGAIRIISSVFSGNTAGDVGGVGMFLNGTIELENTTMVGNTADCSGALYGTATVSFSVSHSTIVRNHATGCPIGGIEAPSHAAGLDRSHSIIAENTGTGGDQNCSDDILDDWGPGTYMLYDSAGGACGSTSGTDIVVADVGLAVALADNGGPVETLAIETTSPALDAIPAGSCSLAADARGYSRPNGPGCDIGAFEIQ